MMVMLIITDHHGGSTALYHDRCSSRTTSHHQQQRCYRIDAVGYAAGWTARCRPPPAYGGDDHAQAILNLGLIGGLT
jgi:hypothetical protein